MWREQEFSRKSRVGEGHYRQREQHGPRGLRSKSKRRNKQGQNERSERKDGRRRATCPLPCSRGDSGKGMEDRAG